MRCLIKYFLDGYLDGWMSGWIDGQTVGSMNQGMYLKKVKLYKSHICRLTENKVIFN